MGDGAPDLPECPDCGGKGTRGLFTDGPKGGRYIEAAACLFCGGKGRVDPRRVEWRRIGRGHLSARVQRRESVRDCAARLGITPAELSAMEHGRADPARLKAGEA